MFAANVFGKPDAVLPKLSLVVVSIRENTKFIVSLQLQWNFFVDRIQQHLDTRCGQVVKTKEFSTLLDSDEEKILFESFRILYTFRQLITISVFIQNVLSMRNKCVDLTTSMWNILNLVYCSQLSIEYQNVINSLNYLVVFLMSFTLQKHGLTGRTHRLAPQGISLHYHYRVFFWFVCLHAFLFNSLHFQFLNKMKPISGNSM